MHTLTTWVGSLDWWRVFNPCRILLSIRLIYLCIPLWEVRHTLECISILLHNRLCIYPMGRNCPWESKSLKYAIARVTLRVMLFFTVNQKNCCFVAMSFFGEASVGLTCPVEIMIPLSAASGLRS